MSRVNSHVNAHVNAELIRQAAIWDEGSVEGYESDLNQLPPYFFDRPYYKLTARERAYIWGRETRIHEKDGLSPYSQVAEIASVPVPAPPIRIA